MSHVADSSPDGVPKIESELEASISVLLDVVERVGRGELLEQLECRFPETHPVGALTASLNTMIEALAEARARSETHSRDLQEKLDAIDRQQVAIQELSTPVLQVWEGIVCMPIVGLVDSGRTSEMARALLSAIVDTKARYALIDITGIHVMDTRVVDHFIRMARAVRLLGARCALSGVHPNVSRTIVHMGLDLKGIETHRSMREALRYFVHQVDILAAPGREVPAGSLQAEPTQVAEAVELAHHEPHTSNEEHT